MTTENVQAKTDERKPGSKLADLVGKKAIITDSDGVTHALPAWSFPELADAHTRLGAAFVDRILGTVDEKTGKPVAPPLTLADWMFMLWLSMRREGVSREQLNKGKYALTELACANLFEANRSLDVIMAVNHVLLNMDFIKVSTEETKGNPTVEPPKAASE